MEETQTIQQMCASFGVTARTLRFYESKELLSPKRQGTRRLFTRRDSARLKLILRGKRFGFSLEEIRQLLDMYDIGDGKPRNCKKPIALLAHAWSICRTSEMSSMTPLTN